MNYAFNFQGKAFTPDGRAEIADVDKHNRETESREIEWLKTSPDKVMLYVKDKDPGHIHTQYHCVRTNEHGEKYFTCGYGYSVTTWLGTTVSTMCAMGSRVNVGFGRHTYRRAVSCRIFGTLYHGWYMESSGNYCRLRKAKRQTTTN